MKIFFFTVLFAIKLLATDKVQIALNWKPEPQFGGFYQAAMDNDYSFDILEGGSGTPTIQMLANDQVKYAIVSSEEILINNDKNPTNKVIALFATFQKNPQIVMCRPELNIQNWKQLFESKATLAIQGGLTYTQYLKQKYSGKDIKMVPYLGGVTNFLTDKSFCQQGFATSEPLIAMKNKIKPNVLLVSDSGFNPYTTVLAVKESFYKNHPDEVNKFTVAIRKGWEKYLKNPAPANLKMMSLNKAMDLETFKESAETQKVLIATKKLGSMSKNRWQTLISQLKDLKIITNSLNANEQFVEVK